MIGIKKRALSAALAVAAALALLSAYVPPAVAAGNFVVSMTGVGFDNNQAAIQDALDDAENKHEIVTVTGSASFRETLNIKIPSGKTVVWQAELDSTAVGRSINITGGGDFEVVTGGVVKASSANAIYVAKGNVTITGTGRVEAGDGNGYAITIAEEGAVTLSQWASVTAVGNAVYDPNGIVILSDNAKVTGNICIRAFSTMISGGTVMSTGVDEASAILSEKGLITVSGGSITSASVGGTALKCSQGSITVSGGTVVSTGAGGFAVYGDRSRINVTGGAVTAIGDGGTAIYCADELLTVSGGVVESRGDAWEQKFASAIYVGSGGVARVVNGDVKAPGTGGYAIAAVSYGAAAYLRNTISAGAFFVDDSAAGFAQGDNGIIVEVDSLAVTPSRNGGSEGLTRKAGGGAAVWDMSDANPRISILMTNGVKREIEWGEKQVVFDITLEDMNYVRGYGINLIAVVQKDFFQLRNVVIDGVALSKDSEYRADDSSAVVTLLASYLDTLAAGGHSLAIGFTDGSKATATITVISIWTNPFTDVPVGSWYYDDVQTACEMGLIDGKTPTLFDPGSDLTYAEAVKLAACMHQLYTTGKVTLTNARAPEPWYQSYVDYCRALKIIGKDYEWGRAATRADYIEVFAGALPDEAFAALNQVPDGSIRDVPMDHPQAAAIYKLYRAGIVEGSDAVHNCKPDSNIVRREVAAILTRMMDETARKTFTMP